MFSATRAHIQIDPAIFVSYINLFFSNTNFDYIVQNLFKGTITEVDIGLSNNDKIVSYALSFGNFTDVTYKTPQKLKNYLGYKAYILFGFLTFRRIKSVRSECRTKI